jgi:hypothetical protein
MRANLRDIHLFLLLLEFGTIQILMDGAEMLVGDLTLVQQALDIDSLPSSSSCLRSLVLLKICR